MSFSQVVGHEQAIQVLRRAIHAGRVPQAYLFVGPPNVGKTLVAREFAKAINCERLGEPAAPEEVEACDECHNCVRIEQGNHPDFGLLVPAVEVKTKEEQEDGTVGTVTQLVELEDSLITTGAVQKLIDGANLKRADRTRRKVYIIHSADRMNAEAANRLLKTLEEPPGQTTFVLTTANPASLLPTTISRCQTIRFQPSTAAETLEALTTAHPEADEQVMRRVAALAGGRYGRARELLEQPEALQVRDDLLEVAAQTAGAALMQSLALGEKLADLAETWWDATEQGEAAARLYKQSPDRVLRIKLNELLDILQTWYRDLALVRAAPESGLVMNADRREQLVELAQQYHPAGLSRASEVIEATRREIRQNANLRLACEVLMLKLIAARRRR